MPENPENALEAARGRLRAIVEEADLLEAEVTVSDPALTPEEAIGVPERKDYPLLIGKEKMIEAEVRGCKGQAFTDSPRPFKGTVAQALDLPLGNNQDRAVFIATLNAVLASLGRLDAARHCRNEEPARCGQELAGLVLQQWGPVPTGLIGLNPSIAEALANPLGSARLFITDLDPQKIGTKICGVPVWDGRTETEKLIRASKVVILTGTTLVNGTFDAIFRLIREADRHYLIFGVTAAGVCRLMQWNHFCPFGKTGS